MLSHQSSIANYQFSRYLAAKKPLDDRSLNQHVWDTMARAISPEVSDQPIRILEIGCGIGTMFERLLERGLHNLHYIGIDSNPENITQAQERFPNSPIPNYQLPSATLQSPLSNPTFILSDLFSLSATLPPHSFDLLIAHAVLDLLDLPRALPLLFSYLLPGGVFYFTLNFDGETIFQPEHPLDPLILTLYHRTMDERLTDGHPSGDSRTGRHLFAHLKNVGAEILAAGSSDWVVYPGPNGYPGDEAYFLHHILHFFEQSLTDRPELGAGQLSDWLTTRHEQVERGQLVYLAHQLDFVGHVGRDPAD